MKRGQQFIAAGMVLGLISLSGCGTNAFNTNTSEAPSSANQVLATSAQMNQRHLSLPQPASIQSVTIKTYGKNSATFVTNDPKSVAKQVCGWLKAANPVKPNRFQSKVGGESLALHMTMAHQSQIAIFPSYTSKGSPVQNVVAYKKDNTIVYLESPPLYNFLVKGEFPTEFLPKSTLLKNVPYTKAQLANMTAKELANYSKKHPNEPLPFAGSSITRSVPSHLLPVSNSKSGSMFGSTIHVTVITKGGNHSVPNVQYNANEFQVIDRWSGSINGKSFKLEVDRKKDGSAYIVGIANGSRLTAYSFSKQPYLTNFTGIFMVFVTPNPAQGHPYFAIDLTTGKLLQHAMDLSQYWETVGGYSGSIAGLSKSYNSVPNN